MHQPSPRVLADGRWQAESPKLTPEGGRNSTLSTNVKRGHVADSSHKHPGDHFKRSLSVGDAAFTGPVA